MRHEIAREKLLDRAYGELSAAEAAEVEAHLQGCAECRAEADGIEETRRTMRALPPEEPPPGEGILLAAARQATERGSPGRAGLLFWLRPVLGAAVVVAVVGVSWKLIGPGVERAVDVEAGYRDLAAQRAPSPAGEPPAAAAPAAPPAPAAKAAPAAAPPASEARAEAEASRPPARRKAGPAQARGADAPAGEAVADRVEVAQVVEVPEEGERKAPQALRPAAGPVAALGEAPGAVARAVAAGQEAHPGPLDEAEELVRTLRRQRDEGKLNEARRRPDPCPGGDVERVAWLDGWGKARRLARTGPLPAGMGEGEVTRDQYYDAEGRLRLVHLQGTGPEGRFARRIVLDPGGRRLLEDPPGKGPWPAADLVLEDPAAAFWAPQRCGK